MSLIRGYQSLFSAAVSAVKTGTLRPEDGDGSDRLKSEFPFNLHRDSSNSLTLSSVGELSWS